LDPVKADSAVQGQSVKAADARRLFLRIASMVTPRDELRSAHAPRRSGLS
jgi:hypothetical protein